MSPNHGRYLGGQEQLADMSLCPTIYTPSHQASSCSEFVTLCTKSKSQFRKNPVFLTDDSTRCFCPCLEVCMFYIGLSELWTPMDTSKWFKMLNSDVILFGNMMIKHDKSLDLGRCPIFWQPAKHRFAAPDHLRSTASCSNCWRRSSMCSVSASDSRCWHCENREMDGDGVSYLCQLGYEKLKNDTPLKPVGKATALHPKSLRMRKSFHLHRNISKRTWSNWNPSADLLQLRQWPAINCLNHWRFSKSRGVSKSSSHRWPWRPVKHIESHGDDWGPPMTSETPHMSLLLLYESFLLCQLSNPPRFVERQDHTSKMPASRARQ